MALAPLGMLIVGNYAKTKTAPAVRWLVGSTKTREPTAREVAKGHTGRACCKHSTICPMALGGRSLAGKASRVWMSVRWWRTLHQMQSTPQTMEPVYRNGLLINFLAFTLLAVYLIRRRYEAAMTARAAELALQVAALRGG